MASIHIQYFKTRVGEFILGAYKGKLCLLDYRYRKMRARLDQRIQQGLAASYHKADDPVLQATREQLQEYLDRDRQKFTVPLLTIGTDFQKMVWQALLTIPYGETASYLQLASAINKPAAVRAVASANGANAISIIIPCHRVIGSNGQLVGYAGGLATKQQLLQLEQPQLF